MKTLKIFISISILSIFIISCSSTSDDEQSTIPEFDRSAVLKNYADNIIIPRLNNFRSSVDYLKESVDAYVDSPDITTYTELHNSWLEAYINWQYVEMFNIGKAEEIMFFSKTNTYPVNEVRIQENINNEKTDLSNPNDWSCQGFPGLDYMIHGIADSENEIINQYIQNPLNGKYLKVVINELNDNTDLVLNDWNSYRNTFVNSVENTATSAFNMLTNDFVYYFEKGLRTNKIGIPSGVFSNNPLSNKVESYYSSKNGIEDVSRDLIENALNAVDLVFQGKSSNQSPVGPSFKTYLDFIKANNVSADDIGSIVVNKIQTANQKILDLNKNFINQVENDNGKMLAAFDALQTIVVNLKTDMLSLFNVAVDYTDADGD
jgi:predicted lipoprotein